MLRTALLTACCMFFVLAAKADDLADANFQSRVAELEARLSLTPEQKTQVRPILQEHLKSQMATLEKYGSETGDHDAAGAANIQQIRALGAELREKRSEIQIQLSKILSASQMQEFERIREEQEHEFRSRILSMAIDQIAEELQLDSAQADQIRPVLTAHFESQMSILSAYGFSPGSKEKRLSFRKRRRLRKDLDKINAATTKQLSAILSDSQLQAYETLQAEQREKLREQMKQN